MGLESLDRTYHTHHFIFNFTFYFLCLFRVVDEAGLATRQLFGRPLGQAIATGNPSVCLSVTLVYCGQTA